MTGVLFAPCVKVGKILFVLGNYKIRLDFIGTNELAGILIMRVMHKSDYGKVYSRVKLKSGEAYVKICTVAAHLNRKTDIYKKYDCNKFLRIYLVAVSQLYRKKGLFDFNLI